MPEHPARHDSGRSPGTGVAYVLPDGRDELAHLEHRRPDGLRRDWIGSLSSSKKSVGTTFHDSPYMSFSQPLGPSFPPSLNWLLYGSNPSGGSDPEPPKPRR
jgi:hypothetical protein